MAIKKTQKRMSYWFSSWSWVKLTRKTVVRGHLQFEKMWLQANFQQQFRYQLKSVARLRYLMRMLQPLCRRKAKSGSHAFFLCIHLQKLLWGKSEYLQTPLSLHSPFHQHPQPSPQLFHYSPTTPDHSFLLCYRSHLCYSGKDLCVANDVSQIRLP